MKSAEDVVQVGGRIVEAGAGFCRVAGFGAEVALGDCVVAGDSDEILGEVVRLGPSGALIAPYFASAPVAIGAHVFRHGPQRVWPSARWRGRAIDALARPIDGKGALPLGEIPSLLDRPPPRALERRPIQQPLASGVRAIDAFTPLCYGQRIGIFAGSGVGKSRLLGMLARAGAFDDIVIGLIGERGREVREFAEGVLGDHIERAVLVVSTGDESALMRRLAGRLAFAVAEWFRDRGRRVLLILDSVTRFAQASRELGIAAGEPAVARGFPPSVFADLPRLLERAGPGEDGGGCITGVFSVLIDGDDHNDPVADSIRGILDGHIVLQRAIADQGRYPAIDVLSSISRLADRAWTPEQAGLVKKLKAMIARYEESRDLRSMGAYHPGGDADLDACVELVPRLYDALTQSFDAPPSEDAFREIADALQPARTSRVAP